MPSPRQTFDNNFRPAELLLQVYRLFESNNSISNYDELVTDLKSIVDVKEDEYVHVIINEIFLGLVRESAQMHPSTFRRSTLCHLLRQAIVTSSTALETFLPALLRENLPTVIQAIGRSFIPLGDKEIMEYFEDLNFSLDETLRLIDDENAAIYISNKIIGLANFKYLSSRKGVFVVAKLLGLSNPWEEIAEHLGRDRKELMKLMEDAVSRRNDIVHRADRSRDDPEGDPQEISYAWTKQSVDTINHICLALDELVSTRMVNYEELIQPQLNSE